MKRFILFSIVLLLSVGAVFASELYSFGVLGTTKTYDLTTPKMQGVGCGVVAKMQYIEDFSAIYPMTYGYFANSEISFALEETKDGEDQNLFLEAGFALGVSLAMDYDEMYLTASLGPSFYFYNNLDVNAKGPDELCALGFYGDVMACILLINDIGIHVGVQGYLNLLTFDAAENSTYVDTTLNLIPGVYFGLSTRI